MKRQNLSFGAKITIATATLSVVVALLAGLGFRMLSYSGDALANVVTQLGRHAELTRNMDAAVSNMAASQRGLVLFAYAKEPSEMAAADSRFEESRQSFQRSLAELRPLLRTDRGREL